LKRISDTNSNQHSSKSKGKTNKRGRKANSSAHVVNFKDKSSKAGPMDSFVRK
jgi:hypothetical protein